MKTYQQAMYDEMRKKPGKTKYEMFQEWLN